MSEKRVAEVKSERHSELKVVGIDQSQHISDDVPIIRFVPNTEMSMSRIGRRFVLCSMIFQSEN